jgi:hypothetical protein
MWTFVTVVFFILFFAACLLMVTNVWGLSHRFHRALEMTWDQLSESTTGRLSRLTVILGALPFWFFRLFFLVVLIAGAVSLIWHSLGLKLKPSPRPGVLGHVQYQ